VPLFIVIDALGILPFVISLSEGMSEQERRKMIHVATITAVIVGLVFLFLGQFIPQVMNISVGSFAIAGGLKAISKVFSLLLAAIAVSMIIHGLELVNTLVR